MRPMTDENQGLGGVPAPKGLPLTCSTSAHVVLPGRTGEALWPGRDGGKAVLQNATALAPLHISYGRHRSCRLLAVQVLLASLAFPTPSFLLFHQLPWCS